MRKNSKSFTSHTVDFYYLNIRNKVKITAIDHYKERARNDSFRYKLGLCKFIGEQITDVEWFSKGAKCLVIITVEVWGRDYHGGEVPSNCQKFKIQEKKTAYLKYTNRQLAWINL